MTTTITQAPTAEPSVTVAPTTQAPTMVIANCGHPSVVADLYELACGEILCHDCGVDHQRYADCLLCSDFLAMWGE